MASYDESEALRQYMLFNWHSFMTPVERRANRVAALREKARYDGSHSASEGVRKRLAALYDAEVDDEIRALIGNSLEDVFEFQRRVAARINAELAAGELRPNRCPACNCIVKTPQARQCLRCGHDWHARIPR
jgi:hypothetical protein